MALLARGERKVWNRSDVPERGVGVGLWEAARGALAHWVTIEGRTVENYQIVATFSLANYIEIFRGDTAAAFRNAFWNTTTFTIVTVIIETTIGVCMALVMNKAFRGRGLVRASILVPWAIPTAMSALLWRWIFSADGVANDLLRANILWTTEGFQAPYYVSYLMRDTSRLSVNGKYGSIRVSMLRQRSIKVSTVSWPY